MQSKSVKMLSLIVPVYRQEQSIRRQLKNILNELSQLPIAYELIVVMDGGDDRSLKEVQKVKSRHMRIYDYAKNRGKGYAVRYGMERCRGNIIGFMDAGGDLHERGITMMLEHFRWYNADIIVGSKRHPVSEVRYPPVRTLMSFGYQLLCRVLFGLNIRDTQAGMKLFRREVLEDVLPALTVDHFAFDIEILVLARKKGYTRIYESPIKLDFTGASSITSRTFWRIILRMLMDTLGVFYRLHIAGYQSQKRAFTNSNYL